MDNSNQNRLRDQIREDLEGKNFWSSIKDDYSELHEYFLDKQKKEKLKQMGNVKKFFFLNWWLLKAMLMKLSPVRRLLLLVGIVLILFDNSVKINGVENNSGLLGAIIILFVLMLELKDKLLAKTELKEGREVQQALMPNESPQIKGWDIWLYNLPANDVGGDLIDFVKRKDGTTLLTLGDVSGKGLGAALFSIKLQSSLRTLAQENFDLKDIISRVNELFYRDGIHNRFASIISLSIREHSDEIEFVNAGHMPPIILRKNSYSELPKGDIAIGLTESPEFNLKTLKLDVGETLVLYSDGVIETENRFGMFYGKERMLKLFQKFGDAEVQSLGNKLVKDIAFFRNDFKMHDDVSIAIVRRTN